MGKAIVAGGKVGMEAPATGVLAVDIAVGSTVYVNVDGVKTAFIVVHSGLPATSYDASCDGVWLTQAPKSNADVSLQMAYQPGTRYSYKNSTIHSYLNGTYISRLDANVQSLIKQVILPYSDTNGSYTGTNGVSTRVFTLSAIEMNFSRNDYAIPRDGSLLSYFNTSGTELTNRRKFISGYPWWTRSGWEMGMNEASMITGTGELMNCAISSTQYSYSPIHVRPSFIIPYNALFDKKTLILLGVK